RAALEWSGARVPGRTPPPASERVPARSWPPLASRHPRGPQPPAAVPLASRLTPCEPSETLRRLFIQLPIQPDQAPRRPPFGLCRRLHPTPRTGQRRRRRMHRVAVQVAVRLIDGKFAVLLDLLFARRVEVDQARPAECLRRGIIRGGDIAPRSIADRHCACTPA